MSVSQLPVSISPLDGEQQAMLRAWVSQAPMCVENVELKCTAAFLSLFSNSWAGALRKASRIWHYHFWLIYTLLRYEGRREVIFKKKCQHRRYVFFSPPASRMSSLSNKMACDFFMGALGAHNGLNLRDMPNALCVIYFFSIKIRTDVRTAVQHVLCTVRIREVL